MLSSRIVAASLLLAVPSVSAAQSSLGFGLSGWVDPSDHPVEDVGASSAGIGGSLFIPVRLGVTERSSIRVTTALGIGGGVGEGGETVASFGDPLSAVPSRMIASFGSVTVGPEIRFADGFSPYLAAGVGLALTNVTLSQLPGTEAAALRHPDNQYGGFLEFDVHTTQLTPKTELAFGVDSGGDGVKLWAEAGLSMTFLPKTEFKRAREELAASRQPFAFNPVGLAVGLAVPFG